MSHGGLDSSIIHRLVRWQRLPLLGRIAAQVLGLYGIEFPVTVVHEPGLKFAHRAFGLVLHPTTRIGRNVTFFPGVLVGRYDASIGRASDSDFECVIIEDDVVVFAGAKVVGGKGVTRLARGSVLAPNAVLTQSTGEWEIWGGIPARRLSTRENRDLAVSSTASTDETK